MSEPQTETIEWVRPPGLHGIDILRAEGSTRPWRVLHQTYTICMLRDVSGGDIEWTYRGKLYRAGAGELTLMEPGEVHANTRGHPPCAFRAIFIDVAVAERAAAELSGAQHPHLKFAHVPDAALFQACARFHASLEDGSSLLERESRLAACIRLFFQQCTERGTPRTEPPSRAAVLRARHLICEQYWRPISLEELASVSGLSRYHVVRAFARQFGLPPHAYQIRVQVERAKRLLAAGVTPAEAAADVGFADQSHFTRHFKKVYGVTPGLYAGRQRNLPRAAPGRRSRSTQQPERPDASRAFRLQ